MTVEELSDQTNYLASEGDPSDYHILALKR